MPALGRGFSAALIVAAAGFLIHQRSPLTPWLVLGLLPLVVGLFFVL